MNKKHESEFMSELQAASRMTPAAPIVLMFFSIIALVVLGIVWASVSQVEKITRGQGQVVPAQDVQYVQSLEGGIVQDLLVREGQIVKSGDVLVRLSDIQSSSQQRGTQARAVALKAQQARLKAEIAGEDFAMPAAITDEAPAVAANEIALYTSRQQELKNAYNILDDRIAKAKADISEASAQVNRLYQNRKLLNQELAVTRDLVRKRAVPKLEEIRLSRELADVSGQINALAQSKKSLEAEAKVAQTERDAQDDTFRSQALTELGQVETEIKGLEENLTSIGDRVDRAEIKSPVDGVVNKIAVTTVGGVVEPAMRLMEIVPVDAALKITAKIPPNEIGFIRVGQDAKVKVSAYDPQIYGALEGQLVRIGANATPEQDGQMFFEVDIETAQNYVGDEDNPLPISSGMQATVEIITGKRTIMNYLLKPLFRARERILTER